MLAKQDILVHGSRIATYDGRNVTVKSLAGNVDAGAGGLSFRTVEQARVRPDPDDPGATLVETLSDPIPGSGILATTFSYGSATVGNVTIAAPQGDIRSPLGGPAGIFQAVSNGTSGSLATVTLLAGTLPAGADPGCARNIRAGVIAAGSLVMNAARSIEDTFIAPGSGGPPPILTLVRNPTDGSLTLAWTDGTLQQAETPERPFRTVNATSPLTLAPDGAGKFYRALK